MATGLDDAELGAFLAELEASADAYVRGDMDAYLDVIRHADGFTLFKPTGGPPQRYADRAPDVLASAGMFRNGASRSESVEVHAWSDTLVVALVERQHGEVADLPPGDLSLRVTQVFRRTDDGWLLVHRHADPHVRPMDLDRLHSLLAGGCPPS